MNQSSRMLLFTASIVLLSTTAAVKKNICDYYEGSMQCDRTNYGLGVGIVGVVISGLAVILSIFDNMNKLWETSFTGLATILYFFGVIFLTSASGPAKAMGNMYFSLWGGCFISLILFLGAVFPTSPDDERMQQGGNNNNVVRHEEDRI